jgi:hypothetical protein
LIPGLLKRFTNTGSALKKLLRELYQPYCGGSGFMMKGSAFIMKYDDMVLQP